VTAAPRPAQRRKRKPKPIPATSSRATRARRRASCAYAAGITTSLITGANKGLGFESARQLIAAGHDVWVAARDPSRGREAADELGARFVQLDVTDEASVGAAAQAVGSLDVLVNNAAIGGEGAAPERTTAEQLRTVYETNVFGPARVLHAFLPLLERSPAPVVVNVSSGLGSLTLASAADSRWAAFAMAYSSSKAALNMLTVKYAAALPAMRINTVDPGYTATDLNAHRGTQTVEEGATAIVRYALIGPDGPTGCFFNKDGEQPW
jgi:NAD(P)-dependent dehydrogenase (short-subunit alcohol dehydrogenase family)